MAETKKRMMTQKAVDKYKVELEDLKVNKRAEIIKDIQEAKEQGDLSENAEYDAALDEQYKLEARITELEKMLQNVEIVEEDEDDDLEFVKLHNMVTILDVELEDESQYYLVSSAEPKLLGGELTIESPLGAAVLGKKVGDLVEVEAPVGVVQYKIMAIEKYEGEE